MNRSLSRIFIGLVALAAVPLQTVPSLGALAPTVSSLGTINDHVSTPVRIASDLLGNIYLSDPRSGGILKFSNQGRFLGQFSTAAPPQGIAVTVTGDLVVGEGTFVAVLSSTGTEKFRLGKGEGQFKMANGIAIDQTGRIFVADSLDNCVQVFSTSGAPLTIASAAPGKPVNSFGSAGSGSGQLSQPTGIEFEVLSGNLAVADTLNGRIEFFTPDGVFVKTIGAPGSGNGKFTAPEGVSFSYGGGAALMYVVDAFQSNIQVIDPSSGSFVRVIGSYGTASGRLTVPIDAIYDSFDSNNSRLVVANDTGNLTVYGVGLPAVSATGGPALSIDPLPLATNLRTLTLTGKMAAGATIKVSASTGPVVGAASNPTSTTWSDAVRSLVPGNNIFIVTATDASGRSTSATANILVLPPSGGAPLTPITVDALPSLVATPLLAMHGTVQAGSTVLVNGNPATVGGGNWSYQAALTEGANSLLITASNPSFSDATTGASVILDSIPPELLVSMLPTGSTTSAQRFPISGTVVDTSATSVQVVVNGGAPTTVPVIADSFSTAAVLALGANSVGVTAVDAAGNVSPSAVTNVTLAPSAPVVSIATPDGTTVANDTVDVTGAASPGSSVTVNGVAATVTGGGRWSATISLNPGLNTVVATATLGGTSASTTAGVKYNPTAPPLAVALPGQNALVLGGESQQLGITGNVAAGTTVSATINGASVPIYQKPDGSFALSLTVPRGQFGTYTVTVTAIDAAGNATTSVRELTVADPTPPAVTVESTSPVKVSVGGGAILSVRDKNGPVGTVQVYGDTASVDLTGVTYDPATLNITAVTPSGSSSRNGILIPAQVPGQSWSPGTPTVADALESLKIASGLRQPGFNEMLHGDVGPLVNGVPMPDGKIDIQDTVATMMRVLGLW